MRGTFDLVVLKVILGSFNAFCLKVVCNSKKIGVIAKGTFGTCALIHIMVTFDLVVVYVVFGVVQCICFKLARRGIGVICHLPCLPLSTRTESMSIGLLLRCTEGFSVLFFKTRFSFGRALL